MSWRADFVFRGETQFFIFDIGVNFRTAFHCPVTGKLVHSPAAIAKGYVRGPLTHMTSQSAGAFALDCATCMRLRDSDVKPGATA